MKSGFFAPTVSTSMPWPDGSVPTAVRTRRATSQEGSLPERSEPHSLFKLFDRLGIKTSWFIPGHSIESFPDETRMVAEAGHEIGIHGYCHENPIAMTRRTGRSGARPLHRSCQAVLGSQSPPATSPPGGSSATSPPNSSSSMGSSTTTASCTATSSATTSEWATGGRK